GSVNQKGQLQPISGINEKIEGFFDVCRLQGLTGTQGVMLPPQNVEDLMLREDVIAAISAGQFHLYAVADIDAGLSILTGVTAAERCAGGWYPPGAERGRVAAQPHRFPEQWYALHHSRHHGPPGPGIAHEYQNH